MADLDPRLDFRDLRVGARVPVIWGPSRPVVNRVLFGLVRLVSPSPYWVEIRGRSAPTDGPGPAELGWIDPGRLYHLGDVLDAPSKDAPPPLEFALISFLRDPSSGPIAGALQLPSTDRPVGTDDRATDLPRVIAVANVDRVDQLWPESPRAMKAVVAAFLRVGMVPYFSTQRATRRSEAADFVFRAVATGLGDWRMGKLECNKAPEGSYWKTGDSVPFPRIPAVSAVLGGKVDSPVR